jgi:hypothetical protein
MTKQGIFTLLLSLLLSSAEARVLKGQVLNPKGEPLPFASLVLVPGNHSTIANEKGRFELYVEPGDYLLQVHYLGYSALKLALTIPEEGLQRNFELAPQIFDLTEVRIRAKGEDPAYRIMRRAIRNAPLHLAAVAAYEANSYVKGTFVITKAPWAVRKLLDQENMKIGTTYVLESVSSIRFQQPASFEEKVLSLRSNLPPGSDPSISFANFNFYRPVLGQIVSPLSEKAFANYRFVYRGEREENGQKLVRIGIDAKTKGPYLLTGDVYLLEPNLSIHSVDVRYMDDNGILYHLEQQYQDMGQLWMPVKQDLHMDVKYLGAHAKIRYVTSVRKYKIEVDTAVLNKLKKPQAIIATEGRMANAETKKQTRANRQAMRVEVSDSLPARSYNYVIDTLARVQSDSVWQQLRQMPLEEQELMGYRQADSLYEARELKAKSDSSGPEGFKWYHPFTGNTYRRGDFIERAGYSKQIRYRGLLYGVVPMLDVFNVVEGVVLTSALQYTHRYARRHQYDVGMNLRYSVARYRLLPEAYWTYQKGEMQWRLAGGLGVSQFNEANPVSPSVNFIETLVFGNNVLKIYERTYALVEHKRPFNTHWALNTSAQWALRRPLQNQINRIGGEGGQLFKPNIPISIEQGNTAFQPHWQTQLVIEAVWRPWAERVRFYNEDRVSNGGRPYFTFRSTTGYAQAMFQQVEAGITQFKSLQKGNSLYYSVDAGTFLLRPVFFQDFQHFNGFRSFLQSGDDERFRNLPFYEYSTAGAYLTAFARLRMGRLALTSINRLRMLGIDEALFASVLITGRVQHGELGYNISGPFRLVGVDFFGSINNLSPIQGGIRLKVGL